MRLRKTASMFQLAIHDFAKTFRRLPEGMTALEFYKALIARREEKQKSLSRSFALAILLVVACSIGGLSQDVSIKTPLLEIGIPKIYLMFLAAYATTMSIYDALSYSLLIAFQGRAGRWLSRRHTNPDMLAVPFGSVSEWTFLPLDRADMLRIKRNYFGEFSAIVVIILPALCLYLSVYIAIIAHVFAHFTFADRSIFMGNLIAVLTVLIALAPLVFLPFPFKQMRLEKNLTAVRWGFLYHMHRRAGTRPNGMDRWIEEGITGPK